MRKNTQKQYINGETGARVITWIAPAILCLLASACATTGGGAYNSASASSTANLAACNPANQAQGGEAGQNSAAQKPCQHRGVIEIIENHPVEPEIKDEFQQAVALLKQEKYPDAIRLLKTVTGKTSKFSGPFIDLGIAYAHTKEYKEAEENLNKALSINALHPVALNELGIIYRKTGRYSEARKVYEKLLQTYPDYLPAHKNLGVLCDIYIQDLNCALEQYEAYVKDRPEDKNVNIWIADVKSRM